MIFGPHGFIRGFRPGASVFDGTNDFMSSVNSAGSDSASFTCTFFINPQGFNVTSGRVFSVTDAGESFSIGFDASGRIQVFGTNAAGTTILNLRGGTSLNAGNQWYPIAISIDMTSTSNRYIYIGETAETLTVTTYANDTLNMNASGQGIGAQSDGSNKISAALGEFWWKTGTFLDLSVGANRRKFYSAAGRPLSLGASGQVPTGSAPSRYHSIQSAQAPDLATNKGSGGNDMVITGSLPTVTIG